MMMQFFTKWNYQKETNNKIQLPIIRQRFTKWHNQKDIKNKMQSPVMRQQCFTRWHYPKVRLLRTRDEFRRVRVKLSVTSTPREDALSAYLVW